MDIGYIKSDPEIMNGVPCFQGTRVPIQNLFDYLVGPSSLDEFLADFPTVPREMAVAVIEAAKHRLLDHAPAA
jgi:uncharacterized protein (DUF433 family)